MRLKTGRTLSNPAIPQPGSPVTATRPGAQAGNHSPVDQALAVAAAGSQSELFDLIAAQATDLAAQQAYVLAITPTVRIEAVSGMPEVNRRSPLILDLERFMAGLVETGKLAQTGSIQLPPQSPASLRETAAGLAYLAWTPVGRGHPPQNGVLYARDRPWQPADLLRLSDRSALYSLRLIELTQDPNGRWLRHAGVRRRRMRLGIVAIGLALAAAALLAMPVTLTVRAPFQVVSRNHVVVSAPIAGVLETIAVPSGMPVKAGEPLIRFADAELANAVAIARSKVELADTVVRRASQLSFDSEEGRKELAMALADLAVRRAELNLALDQSARTAIAAPTAGIVLYSDAQALLGKPFTIGQPILAIADPASIEFEISLDVSDAVALEPGARVTLYPDNAPLLTGQAVLERIGYLPEPGANGRLAYQLIANPLDGEMLSRLGTTGIARIEGGTVPLAFSMFRRPVARLRQWLAL